MTTTIDDTTDYGRDPSAPARPPHWCLTLLFHPDLSRIGAQFLWDSAPGGEVLLSRLSPAFRPPRGGAPAPLDDARISRSPLRLRNTATGFELEPENDRVRFDLGGRPGAGREKLSYSDAARGVILTLGRHVCLMLHAVEHYTDVEEVSGLLGVSGEVRRVRSDTARIAALDLPVLLTGESGVGKELVAQAIHRLSPRAARRFVTVNMSALPASTAAAELFGHARGAFTGAATRRIGQFGEAEGGTLFLDEIGETPSDIQPMLLRAIEAREVQPLGLPSRVIDVRIIAATDSDLERLTEAGRFRNALLHRLRATTILIPPLRDRRIDIPVLLVHFLREALAKFGAEARLEPAPDGSPAWLQPRDVLALLRYHWPGNVRELRNVAYEIALASHALPHATLPPWLVERIARQDMPPNGKPPFSSSPIARLGPLPFDTSSSESASAPSLRPADIAPETLRATLEANDWRIRATAEALGISRNSVYSLMAEAGIVHAGALTREAILEAIQVEGSREPLRVAARLRVSERGLTLRLRALGMTL